MAFTWKQFHVGIAEATIRHNKFLNYRYTFKITAISPMGQRVKFVVFSSYLQVLIEKILFQVKAQWKMVGLVIIIVF